MNNWSNTATTATVGSYCANDPWPCYTSFDAVLAPTPLEGKLAQRERERKLLLDARSRARQKPVRGASPSSRRLQTYQAAMDARFAAGCCR